MATKYFGINYPVGAFSANWSPGQAGTYGSDYFYDGVAGGGYGGAHNIAYYAARGLKTIRLGFKQNALMPDNITRTIDQTGLDRLWAALNVLYANGCTYVYLGGWMYDYGPQDGTIDVNAGVNTADFWTKLLTATATGASGPLRTHPALIGYAPENEPHNWNESFDDNIFPSTDWGQRMFAQVSQAWVNACRAADPDNSKILFVPFLEIQNPNLMSITYLHINDPGNNFVYDCHSYWNIPGGRYLYDAIGSPTRGIDYSMPFYNWLVAEGARGFFGEIGIPSRPQFNFDTNQWEDDTDIRWLTTLDNFYQWVEATPILLGVTYWAGGATYALNPSVGDVEMYNIEPRGVVGSGPYTDAMAMQIMEDYPTHVDAGTAGRRRHNIVIS